MTTDQITNQMFQRAHFAAILCGILQEWPAESEVTHEDIKTFICKSLQRCGNHGVDDHIEHTLLKSANNYIEQHNAIIEAKQILNQ